MPRRDGCERTFAELGKAAALSPDHPNTHQQSNKPGGLYAFQIEATVSILGNLSEPAKHAVDALAGMTLLATLLSWLPAIGAVLAVLWTCLRIYEAWQNIKINSRKLRGRE